jgi:hypothetical protein
MKKLQYLTVVLMALLLSACATTPPASMDNVCHIFEEKSGWYKDASKATKKWGGSIPTIMAFMHQESRFVHDAKPPRGTFLWIFPGSRPSTAEGYSQALDGTWQEYKSKSGNRGASRNNFADAADFLAWYNNKTLRQTQIKPWDNKALYLAYHEGPGGYNRGTYKNKAWLINVSQGVADRAWRYRKQLEVCEPKLIRDSKFLWIF